MMRSFTIQFLSTALCFVLVIVALPPVTRAQQPEQTGYSGQGVPLSAEELQALVAPIALYPDALVAPVLGAATFPDQVTVAANWLKDQGKTTAETAAAINEFDPENGWVPVEE